MLMDIFSSFDEQNGNYLEVSLLIWVLGASFIIFLCSKYWWVGGRLESLTGVFKSFVYNQVSLTKGKSLVGFGCVMCSLFCLLIIVNLSGLIPYVFSISSHLVFTLVLAVPLWLSLLISSGTYKFDVFVAGFLPSGAPAPLNPFLVVVESISILVRPITLSVRLAANMGAGHIVIGLMGSYLSSGVFSYSLSVVGLLVGLESFYFLFEFGISLIQAYIFLLLVTLYSDEHSG